MKTGLKGLLLVGLCLLPIQSVHAQSAGDVVNYISVNYDWRFEEQGTPEGFELFETNTAPVAVNQRTGEVFALDNYNRVTDRVIGSALYGDHFETTPNGYRVYETHGAPVAVNPNGRVFSAEYSRELGGWDVSGSTIGGVVDNVSRAVAAPSGYNPIGGLGGYVEHTYQTANYGLISTSHNNPEGFANLERMLRDTGSDYTAMDLVDQPLSESVLPRDFLEPTRSGVVETVANTTRDLFEDSVPGTVGGFINVDYDNMFTEANTPAGFDLFETEGAPVGVNRMTGEVFALDDNNNLTDSLLGRAAWGEPFMTDENGFQFFETSGLPVAISPDGIAFATDGDHNIINQVVGRVAENVERAVRDVAADVIDEAAANVLNRFTRLGGEGDIPRVASRLVDGSPISIGQLIAGTAQINTQGIMRYNGAQNSGISLAITPSEVNTLRSRLSR
ncbi:MAG: hypothetical protein AAF549_06115 [Pseudomonadota bacterium]